MGEEGPGQRGSAATAWALTSLFGRKGMRGVPVSRQSCGVDRPGAVLDTQEVTGQWGFLPALVNSSLSHT